MYPIYRDLRDKLGKPLWHDQYGVPRYAPFEPDLLGIYDDWAVLFVVQCQACGRHFDCASGLAVAHTVMSRGDYDEGKFAKLNTLEGALEELVYWGDAPWHDDDNQCSGTTMSSDVAAIKEVWKKDRGDWAQVEVPLKLANQICGVTP